jgi:GT2 family glycosyltransferase
VARCSIIIPVYNHAALTRQCLDAVLGTISESVCEVIVVDDASSDATQQVVAAYADRIRILTHTANAGFGVACNDGAAVSTGEYLVFLNNDTIPKDGWLDALVHYAEDHPEAAVIGSKLLFPNDTIQHAGVIVSQDRNPHHLYAGFPSDHPAVNKSRRFQIVTAACVLIRRELFEQVGGFDTSFCNGYEDVDLCLRLGEQGHEVHYCHESVLYHLERMSREDRSKEDKQNLRLYRSRWADRVRPDEMDYYVEDGLLTVQRQSLYPQQFSISPLLASVDSDGIERKLQEMLSMRSRQVFDLLRETTRLTVNAIEKDLGTTAQVNDNNLLSSRDDEYREPVSNAHHDLLSRDDEIIAMIYALQQKLAALREQKCSTANGVSSNVAPSKYLGYRQLIRCIRSEVNSVAPTNATVIVVSSGDSELVNLDGRRAWHFPQTDGGLYAGYHPLDSTVAIDKLESLRTKGGDCLVFPNTAFWWLDHYAQFREHLDKNYKRICDNEYCVIYQLAC